MFRPTFFVSGMAEREEKIIRRVADIADPVLRDDGLELVEIQYRREQGGWILRLFIDRLEDYSSPADGDEGSPGSGVTLDDCVAVSREVGRLLDVEDAVPGRYTLEVSSPGLNRPLTKEADYQRFSGRMVLVRHRGPEGRRKVKGRLIGLEDGVIRLEVAGETVSVPLDQAERVQLEPELNFGRTS